MPNSNLRPGTWVAVRFVPKEEQPFYSVTRVRGGKALLEWDEVRDYDRDGYGGGTFFCSGWFLLRNLRKVRWP